MLFRSRICLDLPFFGRRACRLQMVRHIGAGRPGRAGTAPLRLLRLFAANGVVTKPDQPRRGTKGHESGGGPCAMETFPDVAAAAAAENSRLRALGRGLGAPRISRIARRDESYPWHPRDPWWFARAIEPRKYAREARRRLRPNRINHEGAPRDTNRAVEAARRCAKKPPWNVSVGNKVSRVNSSSQRTPRPLKAARAFRIAATKCTCGRAGSLHVPVEPSPCCELRG